MWTNYGYWPFNPVGGIDIGCNKDCNGDCESDCKCKKCGKQECEGKCKEPKDNSKRETCYWCGAKTVKKDLFSSFYYQCPKCKK